MHLSTRMRYVPMSICVSYVLCRIHHGPQKCHDFVFNCNWHFMSDFHTFFVPVVTGMNAVYLLDDLVMPQLHHIAHHKIIHHGVISCIACTSQNYTSWRYFLHCTSAKIAVDQWRRRLTACVSTKGRHYEQMF